MASNQTPHLLNQVKRCRRQTLHLKRIAVKAFQPFALGDHHRAVDGGEGNFMNVDLRQVVAFQVKTFRERLQSHQHATLAVINAFTVGFHQPVTRLVTLHQ